MKTHINKALLGLSVLFYIFYFTLISVIKFNSFAFYDFDLAIYDLAVWNILHGSIYNSILGIPFLGSHMNVVLFLIAPFYLIFNHPLTLLILQTIALGLAALPLYGLARRLLDEGWALVISIAYLFYPALAYNNLFEFHPTVFATFFFILAFYYYEKASFLRFLVFAVFACLCQENIPLAVIMFSVLAFFNRRSLKWIIVPLSFGGVYLLLVLAAQSYFNRDTIQYFHIYRHLGNSPVQAFLNLVSRPSLMLHALSRKEVFLYILQIFSPLFFIPLLNPLPLLLALPFFLQHLLSRRLSELSIFYHYTAEVIPFIFVSLIYSIKFILKKGWVLNQGKFLKISLLVYAIFISHFAFGPDFFILHRLIKKQKYDYLSVYKEEFVKKIPPAASVVATFEFLPHLSHRRKLYSFHHVYTGYHTISSKSYTLPSDAELALIDFNDFLTFTGFYESNNYINLQKFLSEGNWQVEDMIETIVLFKKNIPPRYTLYQILKNADKEIQHRRAINVEGEIELIGYNLVNSSSKDIMDIIFYWRCIKPTRKDIGIFLDIVDKKDRLIMRKVRPICYRVLPTNAWQQGEIIQEECRIKVPQVSITPYKIKIGFFDLNSRQLCMIWGGRDRLGRALLLEACELPEMWPNLY